MTDPTPSLPTPASICRAPGCTQPTRLKGGRCETHTVERNRERNDRSGYYRSPEWKRLRAQVLNRDHHQCVVCASTTRLAAHHVVARTDGGPDSIDNLAMVCNVCHSRIEAGDTARAERVDEHMRAVTRDA